MSDPDPRIEKALKIARAPFRAELWPDLSQKDLRVLSLILMGRSNTAIGIELNVTRQGATYLVNAACDKIGTVREGVPLSVLKQIERALTE